MFRDLLAMTPLSDIIDNNINKYAPAMDALAKGEEMSELKPCPFCGQEAEESFAGGGNIACGNRDCQAGMLMLYPSVWNTRPIEDALRAQLAERDALIERLVEAGDVVNYEYIQLWGLSNDKSDAWDKLVSEWQAMKGGEG